MELTIYDTNGQITDNKIDLPDEICKIKPHEHSVYLDVKQHLANKRQGTAKTKERGEVKGSTKKIKKQKGTGSAPAGSIKSPIFRGGGTIFGPKPRNYKFKLNKRVKQLARKSVLAERLASSRLIVTEDFAFNQPSTKEFIGVLKLLGIINTKILFVVGKQAENVYLSSRNIPNIHVISIDQINTYDMINNEYLIFMVSALEILKSRIS